MKKPVESLVLHPDTVVVSVATGGPLTGKPMILAGMDVMGQEA